MECTPSRFYYSGGKEQCTVRRASSGPRVRWQANRHLWFKPLRNFLTRGGLSKRVSQAATINYWALWTRLTNSRGDRVGETLCRSRWLSTPPPRDSSVRQSIWLRIAPSLNEVILCSPAHMCCIPTGNRLTKRCKAAERLGTQLGLRATMIAHGKSWSCGRMMHWHQVLSTAAVYWYNMDRVASAMSGSRIVLPAGRRSAPALENVKTIAHAPPVQPGVYACCSRGSAADGGDLRSTPPESRWCSSWSAQQPERSASHTGAVSANTLLQPLCAAFAGRHVGALAVATTKFVTAAGSGLPLHDSGSGSTRAQRRNGSIAARINWAPRGWSTLVS